MGRYEAERKEHVLRYGSFLHCPEKDTICSKMEDRWETGQVCDREPCILEDPDDRRLQEKIRMKRIEMDRKRKAEPRRQEETRIRDQRNYIKSIEQTIMDEIRDLEERSRAAYRDNNPKRGEELLHNAMQKRIKLKNWTKKE